MLILRLASVGPAKKLFLVTNLKRLTASAAQTRRYSSNDKEDVKKKYTSTVVLPKTTFPGYLKPSQLPKRDQTVAEV